MIYCSLLTDLMSLIEEFNETVFLTRETLSANFSVERDSS